MFSLRFIVNIHSDLMFDSHYNCAECKELNSEDYSNGFCLRSCANLHKTLSNIYKSNKLISFCSRCDEFSFVEACNDRPLIFKY